VLTLNCGDVLYAKPYKARDRRQKKKRDIHMREGEAPRPPVLVHNLILWVWDLCSTSVSILQRDVVTLVRMRSLLSRLLHELMGVGELKKLYSI